jgi:hypothetical protein
MSKHFFVIVRVRNFFDPHSAASRLLIQGLTGWQCCIKIAKYVLIQEEETYIIQD